MRNIPTEEGRPSVLEHENSRGIRPPTPGPGAPSGRKRGFRPIFVVLAIVVVALVVIWKVNHARPMFARPAGGGGRRSAYAMNSTLPVVVQPAVKGDINIYLDGLGTVTPLATVTVQTQISGLLMEVAFKEGQLVNKGDLLAVVDPRPYQVALEQAQGNLMQAQAELTEARVDLGRYQTLAKQDSIALQQVDTQRSLVNQYEGLVKTDQAAIDSANLNLTYCHIIAPVAGRVGLRQVDSGNYITPTSLGNGLVVLTQIQPITVIFTLPEDNIPAVVSRLRSGATLPVEAFDRSLTTKLASGTLATIDNVVDTTTGTFRLRAVFPNQDGALFPSQFRQYPDALERGPRRHLDSDLGHRAGPAGHLRLCGQAGQDRHRPAGHPRADRGGESGSHFRPGGGRGYRGRWSR